MVPVFMITKNSPADLCFELFQSEGVEDEANRKAAQMHLARSDTTPGLMWMTSCFSAQEMSGFLLTVLVP